MKTNFVDIEKVIKCLSHNCHIAPSGPSHSPRIVRKCTSLDCEYRETICGRLRFNLQKELKVE